MPQIWIPHPNIEPDDRIQTLSQLLVQICMRGILYPFISRNPWPCFRALLRARGLQGSSAELQPPEQGA